MGIAQSNAQTTSIVSQVNIALSGFGGDSSNASPAKLSTKDVLNAISVGDTNLSFGKAARLMVVVPADGGNPTFIVRETSGHANNDTDVSSFFSTDSSSAVGDKTRYQILSISFDNGAGTDFNVNGFTTEHRGKVTGHGTGTLPDETTSLNGSVLGTGDIDGTFAILKGTITASGAKVEVQ